MAQASVIAPDDYFESCKIKQVKEPMESIGIIEFINKLLSNPTGSTVKTHRLVQDADALNKVIAKDFSNPSTSAFRETFQDTQDFWFMKQSIWMKHKTFWNNSQANYFFIQFTRLEKSCIMYQEISFAEADKLRNFVREVRDNLGMPEVVLHNVADFLVVRTVYEHNKITAIKLAVDVVEFGGEAFTLVAVSGPGNAFNTFQEVSNAYESTDNSIVRSKVIEYLHRQHPKVYAELQTQPSYADYTLNSKMIASYHPESTHAVHHLETIQMVRSEMNEQWKEAIDELCKIGNRPELTLAWLILIKAHKLQCPAPVIAHYSADMQELSIEWSLQGVYFSVTNACTYSVNVHHQGKYPDHHCGSLNNSSYDRSDIERHVTNVLTNNF